MKKKNLKATTWYIYAAAFFIPIICFCLLCIWESIYPFGEISNLKWDLDIQYVDFLNYYRDVLLGKAGGAYSFTKSLGGSTIAIIGYYCASPFNLLIVFFPPEKIQLFVFIVTALKIGTSGLTFGIFLSRVFKNLSFYVIPILCLAYSFTQYNVGQMANIPWLDGVYMLPLMLLGVKNYIEKGKAKGLYISVALSILFNWYTGYMNCIFIVLYYLYEKALNYIRGKQFTLSEFIESFFKFLVCELTGVLLSCFFFIPVALGQAAGRTAFDLEVFKFGTNGQFLDIFRGFLIGSENPSKNITLFCSIFVLILVVNYFLSKRTAVAEKLCSAIFGLVLIFSLFFIPLENIWCGFKFEASYYYRFLYVVIAGELIIAARMLEARILEYKSWLRSIFIILIAFLFLDMEEPFDVNKLWITVSVLFLYGFCGWFIQKGKFKVWKKRIAYAGMGCIFLVEILVNAKFIISGSYIHDSKSYEQYIKNQNAIIKEIKAKDTEEFYRIEQTLNRDKNAEHNSFFANESMGYNYNGIQHYSSGYEKHTADMLMDAGYCSGEFPSFYHEPILPMDSFLGVKYLLCESAYVGFEKLKNMSAFEEKEVYQNIYSLPLGFAVSEEIYNFEGNKENPFQYINGLYSAVLGEKTEIFSEITDVAIEQRGTTVTCEFSPDSAAENNEIYGNLLTDGITVSAYVNGVKKTDYAKDWMNHKVIDIGKASEKNILCLENFSKNVKDVQFQFYALNMEEFSGVVEKLKQHTFEIEELRDGFVEGKYVADKAGHVLLTIPYDASWELRINGNKQDIRETNSFIVIPVEQGENIITLDYKLRGRILGLGITLFTAMVCVVMGFRRRNGDM